MELADIGKVLTNDEFLEQLQKAYAEKPAREPRNWRQDQEMNKKSNSSDSMSDNNNTSIITTSMWYVYTCPHLPPPCGKCGQVYI